MNEDGNDKVSGPDEGEQSPDESAESGAPAEAAGADEAPSEAAASEATSGSDSGGKPEPSSSDEPDSDAESEEAEKAKAAAAAKAKAEAAAKAKAAHEAAEAAKDPWERDPVVPDWIEVDDDPLVDSLRDRHAESVLSARTFAGDLTLEISRDEIREVCTTLKNDLGYTLPVDICGVDHPDREEGRFEVVYHLYNFETNRRIRVKTSTDEGMPVPSVTPVWRGANWPEREAYDMYGIRFAGHPDMTRILLWEGFNGYPLRKDFPVEGIDTGSAIYPEYFEDEAGPIAGTGTGWKAPTPPEPEPEPEPEAPAEQESGEA